VEQAEAFYESNEYQLALEALGDAAVRSGKIFEACLCYYDLYAY